MMHVSIIIPCVNEPTLDRVVEAAKRELPEAEIIIVSFGRSKEIAEKHSVEFLDMHQKTPKPIGINKAVRKAKHDWIIILDADAIPQPGWGQGMLSLFQQNKQVFSGSLSLVEGNFWMKVYNFTSSHEMLPENKAEARKYLPAVNLGFTREVFEKGGDWNENLVRSQDYEWSLRLYTKGITLWFDPGPCVTHIALNQNSFKNVWNAWVRNGYYNWIIRKQYSATLGTPKILTNPYLVLLFAPILALIPTLRISRTSPKNFVRYFYLLPFVYLTKIAWCWGVYKSASTDKPLI